MPEIAEWLAPVATMIAATMTAANLGPRITGWGFAVFTVGSLAWILVAMGSGQTGLLVTNGLLTIVNLVGVWRWLGREARLQDGADDAEASSGAGPTDDLVPLSMFGDAPVNDSHGRSIGHCIGGMVDRESGTVAYLVVREGGIGGVGERFHALDWDRISIADGEITAEESDIAALPEIDPRHWPSSPIAGNQAARDDGSSRSRKSISPRSTVER